jgi:neutral ceramidase
MWRVPFFVLLGSVAWGQWRVGRAEVDITPPAKMPMAGYYYVRLNEGLHDPLHAKAMVIENAGVRVALVAVDYVQIPRAFVENARQLISTRTGIPATHVMISATHSHTGPELGARLRSVEPEIDALAKGFWAKIPGLIADSVAKADAALAPAPVSVGVGREDSISFIRRFRMIDGSTGWNPGKLNPKIGKVLGTIDPDVAVVAAGNGAYVNFALHLDTVGGAAFSADYAYALSRSLEQVKGPGYSTLFTIGCAGNINHIDVSHNRPQKGHGEAARIGTVLAAAVLKTMEKMTVVEPQPVRVSTRMVALAPAAYTAEELDKARAVVANYGKQNANPFYDQVNAFKVVELAERAGKPLEAEVQVITLGKTVAWVGLPGEIFVEHGRAIKLASPFPFTIVTELANGNLGYVPDRKAYAEGAYEVISSRLAPGGGEAMVAAAVEQLTALYAQQP